ncbi:MAG TPA: hypothetical protein VGS18_01660, partial [Thermoplasmata archaeon]|nr:hypothetical protein [Thermoplasmata archaeon]
MIRPAGAAALVAAAGAFLLALLSLNYVFVVAALALFAFLAAEVIGFHLEAAGVRAALFDVVALEETPRLPIGSETAVVVRASYRGAKPIWAEIHDARPDATALEEGIAETARWFNPG